MHIGKYYVLQLLLLNFNVENWLSLYIKVGLIKIEYTAKPGWKNLDKLLPSPIFDPFQITYHH